MKQKLYLLPHYCQPIGWCLFIFGIITFFVGMYSFNVLHIVSQNNSHYLTLLLRVIFYSSALLIAFSREKEEDEYILTVRYSSIVIAVYLSFVLFILNSIVLAFSASFHFISMKGTIILQSLVNPITIFILYIIIFRIKMLKIRREAK